MTTSLYDLSIGSFLQTISGVQRVLEKGAEYAQQNDIDVDTFVGLRLHDDMLPMLFQIVCVPMHTTRAINGIEEGVYTPPKEMPQTNYAGLQQILSETRDALKEFTPDYINSLAGKTMVFKMGDMEMPFTAENFIMSFSLPNLNFHATTAYDLLRVQGVPLSKADFLGKMRLGA